MRLPFINFIFSIPLTSYFNDNVVSLPVSGILSFDLLCYVNRGTVYGSSVKEEEIPDKNIGDYVDDVNDFYINNNLTPTTKFLRILFSSIAVVGLGCGLFFIISHFVKKKKR